MKDKSSLRAHYLALLKQQNKEEGRRKSRLIGEQLMASGSIQKAHTILFYASMPGEVDTSAMIQKALSSGKRVCLPIVERAQRTLIPTLITSMEETHHGTYGIAQPHKDPARTLAPEKIDAVVVPGLAFDRLNNRLGRGWGYYDRFLSLLPDGVLTVGLAFDFQLTACLPTQPHDVRLRQIIAA